MFRLFASRVIRLSNVIIFREYVRKAPGSRLVPATANPKAAFVLNDEPNQMVEPIVDSIADVMTSIKSATHPQQLFDSIAVSKDKVKQMSPEQLIRTLQTLFGLYKANKEAMSAAQIVAHPSFMILCKKLRRTASSMEVSSVLNALKIVNYLNVPANSELSLSLLSLLRYQINDLSLQEIIYADFLLSQLTPRLEVVEAIKTALPILFEIQLPIQFDPKNTTENFKLLKYATAKKVSPETVGMIANTLPRHLGQADVEQRKDVLRTLCASINVPRTASKLWCNSLLRNARMIEKLDLNEVLKTAGTIVRKCLAEPIFYTNEVGIYLQKCIDTFIECNADLEQSASLQKLLRNISFKSEHLLRHIDDKINADIDTWPLVKIDIAFAIISSFAMAGYQPRNWWEKIMPGMMENIRVRNLNPNNATWLQFTLQLILLNHVEVDLVERVLHKDYMTAYLGHSKFSDTQYLKLVILYHEACHHGKCAIDHEYLQTLVGDYLTKQSNNPLQSALTTKLGPDNCIFNARTKYGHCIQNLVKFDIEKRQFVPFDEVQRDSFGFAELNKISRTSCERFIAIDPTPPHFYWTNSSELKNVYLRRRKQLEHNGLYVFEIPSKYWLNVPDTLNIQVDVLWQRVEDLLPYIQ